MSIKAMIVEQGNGFPRDGQYCVESVSGDLYRVVGGQGRIHTDRSDGNYVWATVEKVDWDECEEGEEHSAKIVLEE